MNSNLHSLVEALGWALLHCLWQGAALGLALAVLLRALKNGSARLRYAASTATLALMVAAFGATVALCWPEKSAIATASAPPEIAPAHAGVTLDEAITALVANPPAARPAGSSAARAEVATSASTISTLASAPTPIPEPQPALASAAPPWSEYFRTRLPWAVACWALGVCLFSARFLLGWRTVRRWVSQAGPVEQPEWTARFAELSAALKVSRPVHLLVSAALTAPAVIGWLKPVVLVPAGIFTGLTPAQLEAIFAHELAHIRRHDYLVNLLQNLVETLFFYHPAAWWISRQMRHERENCCDDLAAELSGGPLNYARALTALEEIRGTTPALVLAATGGSLLDRVRRLLGVREQKSAAWPLGILLVGVAVLLCSFTVVRADRPADPAVQIVEVNNGTTWSYCVHQGGEVRYVVLARNRFTVKRAPAPQSATLEFPKEKRAEAHKLGFSPAPLNPDLLNVSLPGNLEYHYDLRRSRVFFVDFDFHGFSPILLQVPVKLEPVTTPELVTREGGIVAQWLADADDVKKWECTREVVPDKDYRKGKAVATADPAILWAEPNDVGLRLGLGGLKPNAQIPVGQSLPIKQYIRNDGPETLRLSTSGIFSEGIFGEARNAAGEKFPLRRNYPWQISFDRIQLQPGEFVELSVSAPQTILASRDGSPSTTPAMLGSALVVVPGDYTLHLSNYIGQFISLPANAHIGDSRLAPGLGEWTGILQAPPLPFRFGGVKVVTAKPGDTVEIARTHRIQFLKGQIVLSHPAAGMTGTHSYVLSKDGQWPTHGGTWKIADPSGEYAAAWDDGGTRIWYVDSTGIQRLNLKSSLEDAGRWPLAEATGDLAEMPDEVRQALNLPAKKIVPVEAGGLAVRGVSLKNVPHTNDPANLPQLYEADPQNAGKFRQKAEVFSLPIEGESGAPILKVAPSVRKTFYLELGGETYGPMAGHAAVELNLTPIFRQKVAGGQNPEGIRLLENLLAKGDKSLQAMACRLSEELGPPSNPFAYDRLFRRGIDFSIASEKNGGAVANDLRLGLGNVRTRLFTARNEWEIRRVELTEADYTPGEKLGPSHADVLWGEPDPSGMRIGFGGLEEIQTVTIGTPTPLEIFLRNDGPASVKLSWTPRTYSILRGMLVDASGKKHPFGYSFGNGLLDYQHTRLEPGHAVRVLAQEVEFFATEDEVRNGPWRKGFEWNPRFSGPPGEYRLTWDYRIGDERYSDLPVRQVPGKKLEWTGLLTSKPVTVKIVAP